MTVIDTSVLVDGLTGAKHSIAAIRSAVAAGERIVMPSLVLYEWLRGPRVQEEVADQEALLPTRAALPFGSEEAAISAELYRRVPRARGREMDLAIAACAIAWGAALWTLNPADFRDLPGLQLYSPTAPGR